MLILALSWTETERGWGQRPDGYTLHKSKSDMTKYVDKHWEMMRERYGDSTPDEYSYPSGEAFGLDISDELYEEYFADGTIWKWVKHLPEEK